MKRLILLPAQIAVLLALTAELFDDVLLDRMTDAEQAVRKAPAEIPAQVSERLDTADKLSDEDRKTIIAIARQALEEFSAVPDSKVEPGQETDEQPKPETKAEPKPEFESKPEAQMDVKPKPKAALKEKS